MPHDRRQIRMPSLTVLGLIPDRFPALPCRAVTQRPFGAGSEKSHAGLRISRDFSANQLLHFFFVDDGYAEFFGLIELRARVGACHYVIGFLAD